MSQDTNQAAMPVFYTHPNSRGRVARWMLEEVGAPYTTRIIEYGPTGTKSADFLAINPMGKLPALTHRGHVVTENAAICAYLADAYPEAGLAPAPGDPARADYMRWLFFVAGPLEGAMLSLIGKAEIDPTMAGYGRVEDVVNTLDQLLQGRSHVAGDRFSAADLMLAAYIGWYMDFKLLEVRPSFEAYVQQHRSRPAALRAGELDNAEDARLKQA